jgi:hypothetical protein
MAGKGHVFVQKGHPLSTGFPSRVQDRGTGLVFASAEHYFQYKRLTSDAVKPREKGVQLARELAVGGLFGGIPAANLKDRLGESIRKGEFVFDVEIWRGQFVGHMYHVLVARQQQDGLFANTLFVNKGKEFVVVDQDKKNMAFWVNKQGELQGVNLLGVMLSVL